MPTWANCKNGSTGSAETPNNAAKDLALFSSTSTPGYNYSSETKKAGNGLWEAICYGRAHSYDSSAGTYSYTLYVFAKKLNSATSWGGQWKVVFYYRGKTHTESGLTRYLNGSGETRLIASYTFTDLSCTPSGTTTIGAKVTGQPNTETYQTIDLTGSAKFTDDVWTSSVTSDSALKVSTTTRIGNRGYRHARVYEYKKASATSYTTDATYNYVADNDTDALSHSFTGLSRDTEYDLRVNFKLRNYNPSDDSGNNPVPLTSSGLRYTVSKTTEKSDLSGSVSLSGSRQIGKTLTANVDNPNNATLEYQWSTDTNSTFSSGDGTQTVLSGETSSSLVVPTSALDKYIYCKVTFTKSGYNTKTIRKYTQAVAYRQPFSGSVTITGTNKMNGTLTASVTTTSGGKKTYQWWTSTSSTATSGTAISGATSSTFKITSSQIGKYIGVTVKITQTNTYEAGTINDITSGTAAEIKPTVTAPTMKSSLTYAGSALALINAGSVTGGTMHYYANTSGTAPTAMVGSTIPTGLPTTGGAAQTYHVWYKVVGDTGYTDIGITKIGTVTVNPGTFTVTTVPYSGNYDGSAHKASIKVNLAGCTVKSGTASGAYGTSDSTSTTANTAVSLGATSRTNAGTTTVYYQVSKSYYKTVTGSTTIFILPSVSISASQDYLKGDYGVPSGTISYSLEGGVGTCTNITLTSNNVKIFDNAAIAASGSTHPKAEINTTISYSITYKDASNSTKTLTGTKTVSFPYNKSFDYTYSHINENGTKVAGTTKGFVNDGRDASKQFCLTATEWNDMNKFLYSLAFRKNGWSATGLTAPNVSNVSDSQLTAIIYNNSVALAEKITGVTYNRVTSGSRVAPEHLNGFRTIINNNR